MIPPFIQIQLQLKSKFLPFKTFKTVQRLNYFTAPNIETMSLCFMEDLNIVKIFQKILQAGMTIMKFVLVLNWESHQNLFISGNRELLSLEEQVMEIFLAYNLLILIKMHLLLVLIILIGYHPRKSLIQLCIFGKLIGAISFGITKPQEFS